MGMDIGVLYENAARKHLYRAQEKADEAALKREQMNEAPLDWQMILLNEAIILDREANHFLALSENLNKTATVFRES